MSETHPLLEIRDQLEKAFFAIENNLLPVSHRLACDDPEKGHTWFPHMEILEEDDGYTVRVETRGLDVDEIDLSIEDNVIVLTDAPADDSIDDGDIAEEYLAVVDECNTVEELSGYAPCACRISLPANVDTNEVVADFVEDMLEIQLPKLAMAS